MRGTAVWFALFLYCVSACGETVGGPPGCQNAKSCDDIEGPMDFCCLADESKKASGPKSVGCRPVEAPAEGGVYDVCLATLKDAVPHMKWDGSGPIEGGVRVIIASLPSPFRTGTASLFDPALEGLIAALSDAHFIRDRSWLWDVPEKDRDAGKAKGSGGKKAKVSKIDCSGVLPGVMLFQNEKASSTGTPDPALAAAQKIVVFIVGESPVWGLDDPAIGWAVHRAQPHGRLNIVGPYFSGSATSMQRALAGLESECVRMASGTMTVIEQATKLERFKPVFAVDTRASRRAVLADFVRERPVEPGEVSRVALFREDATAFASYSVTEGNWLDFPISPSVSRVRSAHAELQRKRATEAGMRTPPWLDATLDHDPTAPDLLPTTSRNTIIAEDLKFDGIVQILRRHRITNVGIHLHAAEDVIFATQHLRQAMPEVRPLLMSMDRTFLHPQYAAAMDGALVASAYLNLTLDAQVQDKQTEHTTEEEPSGTVKATDVNAATTAGAAGAIGTTAAAGKTGAADAVESTAALKTTGAAAGEVEHAAPAVRPAPRVKRPRAAAVGPTAAAEATGAAAGGVVPPAPVVPAKPRVVRPRAAAAFGAADAVGTTAAAGTMGAAAGAVGTAAAAVDEVGTKAAAATMGTAGAVATAAAGTFGAAGAAGTCAAGSAGMLGAAGTCAGGAAGKTGGEDPANAQASTLRVFSRDSGPGVYRATKWLLHYSSGPYSHQISKTQRTSQLGVIRRGKIWPLTPAPHDQSLTPSPIPIEFIGVLLFVGGLYFLWPTAVQAAATYLGRAELQPRELWPSRASIALGGFVCFAAFFIRCFIEPGLLMNRTLAVLSGVSPLTEMLLGFGSVGVFLAAACVLRVRLTSLSKWVSGFGALAPPSLLLYQLWPIRPHVLTVESSSFPFGMLLGTLLFLSYVLVPVGLGALLTVCTQRTAGNAQRVSLSAACCVVLALFFLCIVNEYPFHPGRVLESFAAVVLVVTAACSAYCHSQLRPKKGGTWMVWVLTLIPLVIALGTYYPGLRYAIQDWFELRKSILLMLS